MSTTLIELIDRFGYVLEVYDSSAGCTIFIHKGGEEEGRKFDLTLDSMEKIQLGFRMSRNLRER